MTWSGALPLAWLLAISAPRAFALGEAPWIQFTAPAPGSVGIVASGQAAPIVVDAGDWAGVRRAAGDLQDDVQRVSGIRPQLEAAIPQRDAIIIGTLGHSALIDRVVAEQHLDVSALRGQWEATLKIAVGRQLLIIGSDKRGTIFGIYDLSAAIGVSPWYWWADVPPRRHPALSVAPGRWLTPPPAVKYRGIFLNDEAPALTGWAAEKFGGLNRRFYAHVFELLLRLRANYLWPAMWDNCFSEDDPGNPRLADAYGIVMGTSHVEPMMRADKEWNRAGHTAEQWNYETNAPALRAFWAAGIERNAPYENIVTIAMRGKIDTPMSPETNIALLERIVRDQRTILAQRLDPAVTRVPQLWALYKEVQDYYDRGMRVPDDVTLLWSDDNWGNLRRVPTAAERSRTGGAGVYYHFDYVGGPRSYKWLNTNPITKVWEQMNLAAQYDARRIWIVNVGDLKPMEFPIEFFLRLAWNPAAWPYARLPEFGRDWAAREFGPKPAGEIASMLAAYTKYNGRRKPELLAPATFSLEHYREADRIEREWDALAAEAERLDGSIPAEAREAYFQLVLYPIKACAIVNDLLIAAGRNQLFAAQGRPSANRWAERARSLYAADAALSAAYNHRNHGRWDHMMDQTHLGYTGWHDPKENRLPPLAHVTPLPQPRLGVALEDGGEALRLDNVANQTKTITLFNQGTGPLRYELAPSVPWLTATPGEGTLGDDRVITIAVDWSKLPPTADHASDAVGARPAHPLDRLPPPPGGRPWREDTPPNANIGVRVAGEPGTRVAPTPNKNQDDADILIKADDGTIRRVAIHVDRVDATGFVESDGVVAIEAEHFAQAVDAGGIHWSVLPDFGRTLSGVTTFPVTAEPTSPPAAHLDYPIWLRSDRRVQLHLVVAPTLNFQPGRGLRCAVSLDEDPPQIVDLMSDRSEAAWALAVSDAVRDVSVTLAPHAPGAHALHFWRVDPGVVLERLVIDAGGLLPSYLGPAETCRRPPTAPAR